MNFETIFESPGLNFGTVFGQSETEFRDCFYDAPNLGVPLTTRQPAKFLWILGDPIPHCCVPFIGIHIFTKIRQSLICSGSST